MREIDNTCPVCDLETWDWYMVTKECWAEAGFTYYQNVLVNCDIAEVLEQGARLPQNGNNRLNREARISQVLVDRVRDV